MEMNKLNWKWGETSPLCVQTSTGHIKAGDLLWLNNDGTCWSHRDFMKVGKGFTEYDVRCLFSACFVGVAMQSSMQCGKSIRVATSGTFDFPADEDIGKSAIIGDHYGPSFDDDGRLTRSLEHVSTEESVGRIGHTLDVPAGHVYIRIKGHKTD